MSECNFEYLVQFVNEQLDPDRQLDIYEHLNRCEICRDAVCQISQDLKRSLFIYCARCTRQRPPRRPAKMARAGVAHPRARVQARPATRRSAGQAP